jgi:LCP family protein required for cell wall assembly
MRVIPRTRGGALLRFFLGTLIVIGAVAATTAVAGLLQFKQFAQEISLTPPLKHANVVIPNPGDPQTILVIGSDHRAGTPWRSANTDTMMLVRLNGSSQTINVMSVPRDLRVQVPGVGTAKLNSAYSVGGPNLLVGILKTQVFPGLHVNHIIDVNFGGFEALVNAIGCVYTDVDHRYYNNTALTDYSSIDIQPGYQKLCGPQALQFVRFRHTDSDLVRNARQQDFIRWAKDQYGVDSVIANRDKLLRIFGKHTETDPDLHTPDGIENLFNLVAFSAGHRIKQIKFPAVLLPCSPSATAQTPCYVAPISQGAEQAAFHNFMRPTTGGPAKPASASGHRHRPHGRGGSTRGLTADVGEGLGQARALHHVAMPIYFPRVIMAGSQYCSSATANCDEGDEPQSEYAGAYPRGYILRDRHHQPFPAYRMTLVMNALLGQYYGVQGTTWQNPPLLSSPAETRTVDGKKLFVYEQGGSITNVAWHTPQAVYWISNTLTTDISNQQMIAIAASLTRAR